MRLKILEIEERWQTPTDKRFRVRVEDGRVFDLIYEVESDAWSIVEH